jgi:uncharacterized membrane protein YphA (DoxX/SURF4 family)
LIRPGGRILEFSLGILLGAVFLYASFDKILKPADFARIIYHYQLVGPSRELGPMLANLVAVTLPWVEVVVGLALATGFWRREAAAVAAILLVVFLGAVGSALWRGIDIENCGCFSVSGKGRKAGIALLAGDSAMLLAALYLARPRRDAALTSSGPAA